MPTQNIVTLNIPQVIDLAISSPEMGAVNFNLLNTILHVIVHQLQLVQTNVEFRGKDGDLVKSLLETAQKNPASTAPPNLTEYSVLPDEKGKKVRKEVDPSSKTAEKGEVIVLVEPSQIVTPQITVAISQNDVIDMQNQIKDLKKHVDELVELPKNSDLQEAMRNKDRPVVEMFQILTLTKRLDAAEQGLEKIASLVEEVTTEIQFIQYGGSVDEAAFEDPALATPVQQEQQLYNKPDADAPSTAAGTQSGATPSAPGTISAPGAKVADTQQDAKASEQKAGANEKKRASDAGAESLTAQRTTSAEKKLHGRHGPHGPPEVLVKILDIEKRVTAVEETLKSVGTEVPLIPGVRYSSTAHAPAVPARMPSVIEKDPSATPIDTPSLLLGAAQTAQVRPLPSQETAGATSTTMDMLSIMQKDILKLKKEMKKMMKMKEDRDTADESTDKERERDRDRERDRERERERPQKGGRRRKRDDDRYGTLEGKVQRSNETLNSIDTNFNNQIVQMQTQFNNLDAEINVILEKLNSALPGGESGLDNIGEMYLKMQIMQTDIDQLAEITSQLAEERDNRKMTEEAMTEQIELLKTIKADKEDLEDALADKADKCAINRKVSHDQFDTACDELSRGIEEALEKLTTQELLWQQALDEIQAEISHKLDKMELGPLRDFINNKLRMLQERMKSLTALKKEQEAAGTKSKFLKNVNCISCDKDVVMRKQMDVSLMPQPRALPPSRSMAPYLAYELDALRKQQKTTPNSRNLNHFESAISGSKSPRAEDHVCNRYCGGSHTVTTPQQRVTRMGHFLAQWGPGALPAGDAAPTKEEAKADKKPSVAPDKKSSVAPDGAVVSDRKSSKASAGDAQAEMTQRPSKLSKGSLRSGSAPTQPPGSPADSKKSTPPQPPTSPTDSAREKDAAAGAGGDDRTSIKSKDKVSRGSAKGSQSSVKRGSQVPSAKGSLKGSKQGSIPGSVQAIPGSVHTSQQAGVPAAEGIPEETPSELAAEQAPSSPPGAGNEAAVEAPAAEDSPPAEAVAEQPPAE